MGTMIGPDGQVNTRPCSIAEMNFYRGWLRIDLPEPTRTAPRPDTPTAGDKR